MRNSYYLGHLIPGGLYKTITESYGELFIWIKRGQGIVVPCGSIVMFISSNKVYGEDSLKYWFLYKETYGFTLFHYRSERARQLSLYRKIQ